MPLKNNEKAAKSHPERSLFGGGRHGSSVVNSCPNLLFRVFEQAPFLCHFGLHLGFILGADFATRLLFAARFAHRPSKEVPFFQFLFLVAGVLSAGLAHSM